MTDYKMIPGILLFYQHHLQPNANTIFEHLEAFEKYSRLPVYLVNVALGLPPALSQLEFSVTAFHYTLDPTGSWITPDLDRFLATRNRTYKVAIFQDEFWYFTERQDFLNRYQVQCLYTRHKPEYWGEIYAGAHTLRKRVYYLAGYVSPSMVESARPYEQPLDTRPIDVAYRGRRLPFYLGRASQEKSRIAETFLDMAQGSGLHLDIANDEDQRLYGKSWHEFLGRTKAMLGVEGGVSVIDQEGIFRKKYHELIQARPTVTFEEFAELMGERFAALEDRIYHRCLTPRHFEAAAFRNVQVLFDGRYDGIMAPGTHYLALRKDFSNFAEVVAGLRDLPRLQAIVDQTWQDLIGSGRYSYESFIHSFDDELSQAGVRLESPDASVDACLRAYLEDWAEFGQTAYRANQAIQACYAQHPELAAPLSHAKRMLDRYLQEGAQLSAEDYGPRVRSEVQARDRRFWEKLVRAARCDLGIGHEPSKVVWHLDRLTDRIFRPRLGIRTFLRRLWPSGRE